MAPTLRDSRDILEKRVVGTGERRERLFEARKALARHGPGELELQALGAAGNRLAGGNGVIPIASRKEPGEVTAAELEVRAELAQRVEGIGVEEIRGALRHGFRLRADRFRERPHGVLLRPPRIMLAQPR